MSSIPADLPKPGTLPHLPPAPFSSHKTSRGKLVGLEGFTGFKNPTSKIIRHPTSAPYLGCELCRMQFNRFVSIHQDQLIDLGLNLFFMALSGLAMSRPLALQQIPQFLAQS